MSWFNTKAVMITSGAAFAPWPIVAFDSALAQAGIVDFNIIRVTSIVPPGARLLHYAKEMGQIDAKGLMLPCVYERIDSQQIGETIAAGVGICTPKDSSKPGLIYGYSTVGTKLRVEQELESMLLHSMKQRNLEHDKVFISACQETVESDVVVVIAAAAFLDEEIEKLIH